MGNVYDFLLTARLSELNIVSFLLNGRLFVCHFNSQIDFTQAKRIYTIINRISLFGYAYSISHDSMLFIMRTWQCVINRLNVSHK